MEKAYRQFGLAKGIDESENPGDGTVAEAYNIDTSEGTWRSRPGLNAINLTPGLFPERPHLFAEFIPDYNLGGSYYPAWLIGLGYTNTLSEMPRTYNSLTTLSGHGQSAEKTYTHVQGLWRYESVMRTFYTTALLITNGVDPPFIYTQKSGSGAVQALDAIDGGNDNITYLASPPKGRCVARYKERTFMGNIGGEAGNRIYWTGPDEALAFPMNVWPSNYNMDLGTSLEIKAMKVFREFLVIFKQHEVWVLSGEGVGGAWTVEKISSSHEGALGPNCVCEIEGRLVFFNELGCYTWGGGSIRNISHPRLEKTWKKLEWSLPTSMSASTLTNKLFQALHERSTRQVYLTVSTLPNVNDTVLVWNYENDTWNKWGAYWDNIWPEGHAAGEAEYVLRFTQVGAECKLLSGDGPGVFFLTDTGYLNHFHRLQQQDLAVTPDYNIPWRIVTHRFGDASTIKIVNGYKVDALKTGDWDLITLLMRDGEDIEQALHRDASYNYILDSVSAQEHTVNGTSNFQTSAAGPVDVWHVPQMTKVVDGQALTTASGSTKIKFTTTMSSLVPNIGTLLVVPADGDPVRSHTMYDSGMPLWGVTALSAAHTVSLERGSIDFRTNCTGRSFRLLISNSGSAEGAAYAYSNDVCEPGMYSEVFGWEIYFHERGTRRGGG